MPPITTINILSDIIFFSHSLKLPSTKDGQGSGRTDKGWQQPSGPTPGGHYSDALTPAQKIGIPTTIPPLFMPQNPNALMQEMCDKVGKNWSDFMHDMLDAVKYSHTMWKLQAKFKDLKVMAVCPIR